MLAHEAGAALAAGGVSAAIQRRARAFLDEPGISVVPAAKLALDTAGQHVHALHDPTEGGLLTGLAELAAAADAGLEVREEALAAAVLPECHRPSVPRWGLTRSACSRPGRCSPPLRRPTPTGWPPPGAMPVCPCFASDTSPPRPPGYNCARAKGQAGPLPTIDRDEIARYFEEA